MWRALWAAGLVGCASVEAPPVVTDRDGDTILDAHEGLGDADGDGRPNADDDDADGDGYPDRVEAGDAEVDTPPVDHDADGTADFLDADADNDGLADADDDHPPGDADRDKVADPFDLDDDGDGISDAVEVQVDRPDTDSDGVPDVRDADSDSDDVPDADEQVDGVPIDADGDGLPDFRDVDSDDDGVLDAVDDLVDTDGDGLADLRDDDDDGDGVDDVDEYALGTASKQRDTDGDGASDGAEGAAGNDPLDAADTVTVVTLPWRTDVSVSLVRTAPLGRPDVALLLDTACSMGGSMNAAKSLLDRLVDLAASSPDAAVGVGTVGDYTFDPPGDWVPFTLTQPVSTELDDARAAVAALTTGSGTDGPTADFEAMVQAVTGDGYDSLCDGTYDAKVDVPPFIPTLDDPFGGTADAWPDPTEGSRGGLGFRGDGSVPFVVLVTDRASRDADSRDRDLGKTPGGCPDDAGLSDVVAAFVAEGAVPIVAVVTTVPGGGETEGYERLAAQVTEGLGGDLALVPLVFEFDALTGTSDVVTGLADAIAAYAVPATLTTVALRTDHDPGGFVADLGGTPPAGTNPRGPYAFDVGLHGSIPPARDEQAFPVVLTWLGDGGWAFGSTKFVVVVPAE